MKTCAHCKTPKATTEFTVERRHKSGYSSRCKDCSKDYRLAGRERITSYLKKYYQEHKDELREPSKLRARKYIAKHFFWVRSNALKNRGRHKGQSVASAQELASIWRKQRGKCFFTGWILTRANAELDHITPMSKGGSGLASNLRWVHRDVNQAKRDLSDTRFTELCNQVAMNIRREEW